MISDADLKAMALRSYDRAKEIVYEEAFPNVLKQLVNDRVVRAKHRAAMKALRRLIEVDVTLPRNRKGDLANALGLQANRDRQALHVAIRLVFDQLREHSV